MLFQNEEAKLKLEIVNYEFPADGGDPASDDRNWLVLRATYEEGERLVKDTNSCLLTYELKEMTAGLKVLLAGVRESYESSFVEPYFELAAQADGEDGFWLSVCFFLPNTMDGEETAEVECRITKEELKALIAELDTLCGKFPERA